MSLLNCIKKISIILIVYFSYVNCEFHQRISNGIAVASGELPYQVSIQKDGQHHCGGSIIDEYHILTAAHCVVGRGNILNLKLQILSRTINQVFPAGEIRDVKLIIPHQSFVHESSGIYDIAILVLAVPIKIDSYQRPITVAPSTYNIKKDDVVLASGWGSPSSKHRPTQDLRKLETMIIDNEKCSQMVKINVHESFICTRKAPGYNICQGDSGGPLVHKGILVGIASQSACNGDDPDMFTRVSYYNSWINDVVTKYPR